MKIFRYIFFSKQYNKYIALISFDGIEYGGPGNNFGLTISERKYYENSPFYTLERARRDFDVSDKLYRVFVEQYLNYFLPEDDFRKMFSN